MPNEDNGDLILPIIPTKVFNVIGENEVNDSGH